MKATAKGSPICLVRTKGPGFHSWDLAVPLFLWISIKGLMLCWSLFVLLQWIGEESFGMGSSQDATEERHGDGLLSKTDLERGEVDVLPIDAVSHTRDAHGH